MKVIKMLKLKLKTLLSILLVLLVATLTFGKVGGKSLLVVMTERVKKSFSSSDADEGKKINEDVKKPLVSKPKPDKSYNVAQAGGAFPAPSDIDSVFIDPQDDKTLKAKLTNGQEKVFLTMDDVFEKMERPKEENFAIIPENPPVFTDVALSPDRQKIAFSTSAGWWIHFGGFIDLATERIVHTGTGGTLHWHPNSKIIVSDDYADRAALKIILVIDISKAPEEPDIPSLLNMFDNHFINKGIQIFGPLLLEDGQKLFFKAQRVYELETETEEAPVEEWEVNMDGTGLRRIK